MSKAEHRDPGRLRTAVERPNIDTTIRRRNTHCHAVKIRCACLVLMTDSRQTDGCGCVENMLVRSAIDAWQGIELAEKQIHIHMVVFGGFSLR